MVEDCEDDDDVGISLIDFEKEERTEKVFFSLRKLANYIQLIDYSNER